MLQFFGDKPQFNWTTKVKSAEVGGEKKPNQNKKACGCVWWRGGVRQRGRENVPLEINVLVEKAMVG